MIRKVEVFNDNGEPMTRDFIYDGSLDKKEINKRFNIIFNEFYMIFDLFGSKGKIIKYLLKHSKKNNQLIITNKQLAKKLNVSETLIKKTLKELKNIGFINRVGSIITINPVFFNKTIKDYKNNILFYKEKDFK